MKKILFYSVPVIISIIWLILTQQTCNPISIKGPEFLKFYLILVLGFYASVMILKSFKENSSKIILYFMILILLLGIVKLIKGLIIGKPVGYLVMILMVEGIILLWQAGLPSNTKHKQI
ncbi:hypothetical protein JET18_12305 [Chryseobacterium sp. L7]|uniref:DUF4345 domain-containing protein n=1 Tax=Chryseobacterium endalhagicum TaxID=2797638 RepID=A0ABS1QG97_9FLAO|nr:hypothetical protein [Chryseobacterium endalhagicum]MBL1221625.1 hypothetical protein [Chryseobacterium endalhagicum]